VHKVIAIWGLLTISFLSYGQERILHIYDGSKSDFIAVSDSIEVDLLLTAELSARRAQGFLGAIIDSTEYTADTLYARIDLGQKYNYLNITSHNLTGDLLPNTSNIALKLGGFTRLQKQIISDYENSGYPFIKVHLLEPEVKNDTLYARLKVDPYIKFTYDSLVYVGNAQVSKKYLSKYLQIEEGKLYSEETIKNIDKNLRNLPLVRLNGSTQIVFFRGKVRVILQIDDAVTDRVDGVVGLAPNSNNRSNNDLLITGEVNIELNNLFKSGKQLEVHWRNYLQNSQKLDLALTYPYLFNTKIGVNGEFNLNKFDTTFVTLKSKLSLRYQQAGNNYVQFYYQNINSNLLSTDTSAVRSLERIPSNNPYSIDNYGLALYTRNLDYLQNPRKGYTILADIAIGQKTIERNTLINRVKFNDESTGQLISLYDTMNLKSVRLDISVSTSFFIPIKKRGTIHQKISFDGLFANQIFFNELYNFGGFSTLRGFDENEIFASKALSYTIEYRYLIGENSNVGLFINTAAVENTLQSSDLVYDVPYGFGVLANIQVGKGILNLAYALGSQQGNAIQLNAAKFHFGVVNYF
jgi:outer membrane protein assembly factor BamA